MERWGIYYLNLGFNFNFLLKIVRDIHHYFLFAVYKKRIPPVPPRATHPAVDGTQSGGSACTYHVQYGFLIK